MQDSFKLAYEVEKSKQTLNHKPLTAAPNPLNHEP